jgi:hypothetical protein
VHVWVPAQDIPLSCQIPVESHFRGCCPLHCTSPGLQATQPPFKHTGVVPAHDEPLSVQTPPTHFWGCIPLQVVSPVPHPASPLSGPDSIPLPESVLPESVLPVSAPESLPVSALDHESLPESALVSPVASTVAASLDPSTQESRPMHGST